mgnify:CR=1 FL=1
MKIKNFVTGLLAALCLTAVLCPAALAAPVEDDGSWDKIIANFLDKYEDRNKSCSITLGYRNLVTGEEHFYKGGEYMVTCSMYKVPLNMYFTEKVYNGEMDWDTESGGVKYSDILEGSIVRSSNSKSELLINEIGTYNDYRRAICQYMGEDPDTVDAKYYENNFFTAEQMIFCLRTLYENQERFPGLIDRMLEAEPERFFNYHEQKYAVAHKYGYLSDPSYGKRYQNDCAIVYTDEPIAIVMFTDNSPDSDNALADYCTLMADYAQSHLKSTASASPKPAAAPSPSASPAAGASPAPSPAAASSPTPSPVPTKSPTYAMGKKVAEFALKYVGYDYLYGGKEPETGFDCSGYVCWVYNQNGYDVGRTTANGLWQKSQHISEAEAKPGDLVFFEGTYDTVGKSHVGIYLGNGMMVSAGDPIKYANIHSSYWEKHLAGFGRLSK